MTGRKSRSVLVENNASHWNCDSWAFLWPRSLVQKIDLFLLKIIMPFLEIYFVASGQFPWPRSSLVPHANWSGAWNLASSSIIIIIIVIIYSILVTSTMIWGKLVTAYTPNAQMSTGTTPFVHSVWGTLVIIHIVHSQTHHLSIVYRYYNYHVLCPQASHTTQYYNYNCYSPTNVLEGIEWHILYYASNSRSAVFDNGNCSALVSIWIPCRHYTIIFSKQQSFHTKIHKQIGSPLLRFIMKFQPILYFDYFTFLVLHFIEYFIQNNTIWTVHLCNSNCHAKYHLLVHGATHFTVKQFKLAHKTIIAHSCCCMHHKVRMNVRT